MLARLTLDKDEVYCGMSYSIMFHPIRLNSGKVFELQALIKHIKANGLFCPLTRIGITSANYDQELKIILDNTYDNHADREPAYNKNELLGELGSLAHPYHTAVPKSLTSSLLTGIVSYVLFSLCNKVDGNHVGSNNILILSVCCASLIAILDLCCRIGNRQQHGFFTTMGEYIRERHNTPSLQTAEILTEAMNM